MSALATAIQKAGGASILAREIGVSNQRLANWLDRRVPAEYCPLIERAVRSEVRCEDLRPDIDWAYIRSSGPCGKRSKAPA